MYKISILAHYTESRESGPTHFMWHRRSTSHWNIGVLLSSNYYWSLPCRYLIYNYIIYNISPVPIEMWWKVDVGTTFVLRSRWLNLCNIHLNYVVLWYKTSMNNHFRAVFRRDCTSIYQSVIGTDEWEEHIQWLRFYAPETQTKRSSVSTGTIVSLCCKYLI